MTIPFPDPNDPPAPDPEPDPVPLPDTAGYVPIRYEPVAYCAQCTHSHDNHATRHGMRCSYDWCDCYQSDVEVLENNPPEQRAVYASNLLPAQRRYLERGGQ